MPLNIQASLVRATTIGQWHKDYQSNLIKEISEDILATIVLLDLSQQIKIVYLWLSSCPQCGDVN